MSFVLIESALFTVLLGALLFVLLLSRFGIAKRFCCWIGWHSPPRLWKSERFDGCSRHARCPWCQHEGMVDSQGNLF